MKLARITSLDASSFNKSIHNNIIASKIDITENYNMSIDSKHSMYICDNIIIDDSHPQSISSNCSDQISEYQDTTLLFDQMNHLNTHCIQQNSFFPHYTLPSDNTRIYETFNYSTQDSSFFSYYTHSSNDFLILINKTSNHSTQNSSFLTVRF